MPPFFNAQDLSVYPYVSVIRSLYYKEYLRRLDDLFLHSLKNRF